MKKMVKITKYVVKSVISKITNGNFNAFCPTGMVPYNFKA